VQKPGPHIAVAKHFSTHALIYVGTQVGTAGTRI